MNSSGVRGMSKAKIAITIEVPTLERIDRLVEAHVKTLRRKSGRPRKKALPCTAIFRTPWSIPTCTCAFEHEPNLHGGARPGGGARHPRRWCIRNQRPLLPSLGRRQSPRRFDQAARKERAVCGVQIDQGRPVTDKRLQMCQPHKRSPQRTGYTNGYKPKTMKSREARTRSCRSPGT